MTIPSQRTPTGGSNRRIDSTSKVTGETRYVEDITLPGMLHACVLRSPQYHARLLCLDSSRATALPGVVSIITASDIPGQNGLAGYSQDEPILVPVGEVAKQKGAPIALLVAESDELARQALCLVDVEYEPLPYQFTAADLLKPGVPALYPAGNVFSTFSLEHGDLQAAFSASAVLVESEYCTSFQEHSALEREATLGYFDENGRLTVQGGTHQPHWQVDYIAAVLALQPDQIRVIVPPTGGSFGGRQDPWPLVAGGLAAWLTRRPVRLAFSRREVFDASPKRHAYQINMKLGATSSGQLTGIQVRIDANTGAYDSGGFWIPNFAVTASGGAYAWQAVQAYAQTVYTNAPKCGQFRGYGTPQSVFALECSLDELSQRLSIDPLELRLKNCLRQEQVSFLGYPLGESLGYKEVLEALRPSYQRYLSEAARHNQDSGLTRMGVGLAGMWYRFGKSGSLRIETHIELAQDGHFIVYCSAPDYGQGIATVMVQLAAEALGVPLAQIELVNADTALTPDSNILGASRATYFVGGSVLKAAGNLKELLYAVAAELVDCNPAGMRLEGERVCLADNPACSVPLVEVAAELDRLGKSRWVSGIFDLSPQFPLETRPEYLPLMVTGAQLAQVQVDLETGQVKVVKIAVAHDVGRAINPPDAIGQIQGAIVMGIGSALTEDYLPDLSTGFADYILPTVYEIPEVEVYLVEVPSYHGPYGAKGLGEAAILPTAPALINAVSRAIGVRIRQIPATPERVLRAIYH